MPDRCVVCSHERCTSLYVVDGYELVRCERCSVQFVRNMPTPEELNRFYQSTVDVVYEDEDNLKNLTYYDLKLKQHILKHKPTGTLLDVGCSAGHFPHSMRPEFDVRGIEISARHAERAAALLGGCVFNGTLQEYQAPDASFDVVTILDTLDHCPDPHVELAKAVRLLKPGGLVVIKVHNISCLWARLAGRKFYAVMPPAHLVYFNRRSLQTLVESEGLAWRGHTFIAHRLFLKTVPYRLAMSKTDNLPYRIYTWLNASLAGTWPVYKNLHDIITVFAQKPLAPNR